MTVTNRNLRNTIAFDMDGVMIDLMSVIQKHLFALYGVAGTIKQNGQFKIETTGNLSRNKIWKAIDLAYGDIQAIRPKVGVPSLLSMLYCRSGDAIRVVTARPERARCDTWATLLHQFPGIEFDLRIVGDGNKADHLDGIHYFVEDRRRNAIDVAATGRTVFLLDADHNQIDSLPKGIIRIPAMTALLGYLIYFVEDIRTQSNPVQRPYPEN